jgi:putative RecB family exonuclease
MAAVQNTFSPSSLSCFENCPKQYWFRYVEKAPVDTEGIEAFVGKRVHEILERLYRFVGEGLVPSLERVLYRYHQNWAAAFDPGRIRIVRVGTEAAHYRRHGARCLENYYRRHYPFDADETVGLERPIRFHLDEGGRYAVRGIIDRIARSRDGVLEIHDFKTGRRVPRQEEVDRDRQLGLYELGLRAQWRERGPVRLVWHYALSNQVRVSTRSAEQRESLREETARWIDRIRAEERFEPRPSALCGWCEFRDRCAAGAEAWSGPAPVDGDGLPALPAHAGGAEAPSPTPGDASPPDAGQPRLL